MVANNMFEYFRAGRAFPVIPGKGHAGQGFENGNIPGGVFPPGLGIPPVVASRKRRMMLMGIA